MAKLCLRLCYKSPVLKDQPAVLRVSLILVLLGMFHFEPLGSFKTVDNLHQKVISFYERSSNISGFFGLKQISSVNTVKGKFSLIPVLLQSLKASGIEYCQGGNFRLGSGQNWKIVNPLFLVGLLV